MSDRSTLAIGLAYEADWWRKRGVETAKSNAAAKFYMGITIGLLLAAQIAANDRPMMTIKDVTEPRARGRRKGT